MAGKSNQVYLHDRARDIIREVRELSLGGGGSRKRYRRVSKDPREVKSKREVV